MEWGHLARPPVLLDVSPCLYQELATRRQPYYFSTHNAGLPQYECGRDQVIRSRKWLYTVFAAARFLSRVADFKYVENSVKKFIQIKLLAYKCRKYVLFHL